MRSALRKTRRQQRTRKITAILATASLLASGLVVAGIGIQSALAAPFVPDVTVAGTGNAGKDFILAGEDATFDITVSNVDGPKQFNLGVTAMVEDSVTLVSGGAFGQPRIFRAGDVLPNTSRTDNADCVALGFVPAPGNANRCAVPAGKQFWVWSDVNDLPTGGDVAATVVVRPSATTFPVGAELDLAVSAYTSSVPSRLPTFDGSPSKATTTTHTSARGEDESSSPIPVKALRITKTEPSPESELLRGVHANVTTYTVKVEATGEAATNGVTVTDYLPAGLEYLGTAGGDQSAGADEYPTSGSIPGTWTHSGETVETVLLDAAQAAALGLSGAGVYTKVTWTLPAFSGGTAQALPDNAGTASEYEFTYRAAIPLFENELWPSDATPDVAFGAQAANLDNNTGASTRHGSTDPDAPAHAQSLVNAAAAAGQYTGPVTDEALRAAEDVDTEQVDAVDLRVIKSVETDSTGNAFTTGTLATYTLSIGVSEYVDATGITLTDVIPNGLCPAFPAQATPPTLRIDGTVIPQSTWNDTVAPGSSCAWPSNESGATLTGATVTSIDYSSTAGTFTVVFSADDVAAGMADIPVTYTLMQRADYTGTDGGTSSGDVMTNTVDITGTTTPIDAIANDTALADRVGDAYYPLDDSEATITSLPSVLTKHVLERGETPVTAVAGDWNEMATVPFSAGDSIWYRLHIDFADGVDTRGATLEDYLPEGVEFVGATYQWTGMTGYSDQSSPVEHGAGSFPTDYVTAPTVSDNIIAWSLGAQNRTGSSARFMPAGSTLTVFVEGRVTGVSASSTDIDSPLNHAKYQQENVAGKIAFQRDSAGSDLDWTPTLKKGIKNNPHPNGSVDRAFGQGGTNELVVQNDEVEYRIDVTAPQNATDDYVIWDVLPTGVKAADVSDFTAALYDAGTETATTNYTAVAYDTLPAGIQLAPGYAGRSVVVWTLGANVDGSVLAPTPITRGFTLGYTLTVPAGGGAGGDAAELGQSFTNTAGIVSYQVPNNGGGATTLVPQKSGMPGQELTTRIPAPGEYGVGDTDTYDSAEIHLPRAEVDKKLVSTEVGSPGESGVDNTVGLHDLNDAANTQTRIVQGEYATFQYSATIPAHTTARDAILADNGSFGATPYTFVPGSAVFSGPGGMDGAALVDAGFEIFPAADGATTAGTLVFPPSYTNATAADQVFSVRITVRVGDLNNNTTLTNTASFSYANANGGPRVSQTDTAQAVYVEPDLTISKTADPVNDVAVGDAITYTIVVGNSSGRPQSFDNTVVDTIPAGLKVDLSSFTAKVGSTVVAVPAADLGLTGDVAAGDGGTITWTAAAATGLSAVNPSVTLTYRAELTETAGAGESYRNVATVQGYTLPSTVGGESTTDRRGTRSATDDATIKATTLELTKGVRIGDSGGYAPTASAPVGETASYEVTVALQQDINYYNIQLRDLLPPGVDMIDEPVVTVTPAGAGADEAWDWTKGSDNRWSATYTGTDGDILSHHEPRVLTFTYDAILTAAIPAGAPTLTNVAGVSWTQGETGPREEITDDAAITVTNPNVVVTKQVHHVGSVDGFDELHDYPHKAFAYKVSARNTGSSPAHNMTFVDQVPEGVIVDQSSLTASGGVLTGASTTTGGGTITWSIPGPLPVYTTGGAGQVIDLAYTARFADSSELSGNAATGRGTTLTNVVRVTKVESHPADGRVYTPSGPNSVADAAVVPLFPVVVPTKTVTAPVAGEEYGLARVGESFGWTLTLVNTGQGAAQTVDVSDVLPPNWTYDVGSATVRVGNGLPVQADPTVSGRTLLWEIGSASATEPLLPGAAAGALPAARTVVVTFMATPSAAAATTPGVGIEVAPHTNTLSAVTTDTTGAEGNKTTPSYSPDDDTAVAYLGEADLQIVKTGAAAPLVAGTSNAAAWKLTVSNNGPDAAEGPFLVTDTSATLPDGVTITGATGAGWTCSSPPVRGADGVTSFTCARTDATESLASGASFPAIDVAVSVAANQPVVTGLLNTATVESERTVDPDPSNNEDDAPISTTTGADLAIAKTVTTTSPNAGAAIAWDLAITNYGPSISESTTENPITVTDIIPPGIGAVANPSTPLWTATKTGGAWPAVAGDTITWTFTGASIAVGETHTLALNGTINSSWTGGEIENTAVVAPGVTPDPTPGNNTSTVPVDPADNTSLGVTKTRVILDGGVWKDAAQLGRTLPDIAAGGDASYRVTVANVGPANARNVVVTDTPPAELTYSTKHDEAGTWTHATAPVPGAGDRFSLAGSLVAGGTASFIVIYGVDDDLAAGTTLVNAVAAAATNSTNTPTDDDSNNTDRVADLAITKAILDADGNPVAEGEAVATAGEQLTYRLVVTNNGPSISSAPVTVTDALPAGLTLVSSTRTPASNVGGLVTWNDITDGATLAVGGTVVIDLTVAVAPTVGAQKGLLNTATVDGPEDNDPTNDTDTEPVEIITHADMTIVKDVSIGRWVAGENVTYTITVDNDGPSVADATVADVLPAGLTAVSITGSAGWTCDDDTQSCEYDAHPVGTSTITVVATIDKNVPTGTELINTAALQWTDSRGPHDDSDPADVTVTTEADIALVKTAVDAEGNEITTVTAGAASWYALAVTNNGPSDAIAPLTVVDTLPAGVRFVSLDSLTDWTAIADAPAGDGTQKVTFTRNPATVGLLSDATAPTIVYQVFVDANVAFDAQLTNTATATSGTPDPTPGNNTDTAAVTVETFADLGIAKTNVGTPTAGEEFEWVVEVTNHGVSDSLATAAAPIVVTDVLPAGTTFVSATSAGATCEVTTDAEGVQTVTCAITETMQPDDAVQVTLRVAVAENVTGEIRNTATVTPELTPEPADPVYPNEDENTTPPVIEVADLAIEKTVLTDPADIVAGQPITWQLTVTNLGPSNSDADAEDPIVVTDTLPAGVVLADVTGPNADWTCDPAENAFTCALTADLATGDPQVIAVTGFIDPSVQGDIVNTATVTPGLTPQPEDSEENDEDTTTSTVVESADLRILKDIGREVVAGATGEYLIQVFNDGPSTARDVVVNDLLPDTLTFKGVVTDEGETSPWTCAPDDTNPHQIICDLTGDLRPGEQVSLVMEVSAASNLTGDIENVATVTSSTPDPDPTNNEDPARGTFVTVADLQIDKSHDAAAQAVAGEAFTWTLEVTNNGPSDSVASPGNPIQVRDLLPAGVTYVAADEAATCAASELATGLVVCDITETIAAGETVRIDIRAALDSELSGALANTATVTPGETADPVSDNNEDTDTVPVTELADLTIEKTVATASDQIVAGREITWNVTVTNNGPSNSDASADAPIRVVDTLPEGVSFVEASGDGWACEAGDGTADQETFSCDIVEALAVGEARSFTVTGLISPALQGEIVNSVVVTPGETPEPEGADENNTDEVPSTVLETADLAVTKVISETLAAGGEGAYAFTVTNLGPSTARDITLVDTLPEGLAFAGIGGDGWTCAPNAETGAVDCVFDGVLAPAASLELVLRVTVDEGLKGDVVNAVTVSTSTPDPNPANDSDTATGLIAEVVDLAIEKTALGKAKIGESLTYQLLVSNAGPATARGVLVEDLLPEGLAIVDATGDGWSCGWDATTGEVACLLGELAAGETADPISVEVTVLPGAYPEVANTGVVGSTTPEDEDTLDDNSSTVVVPVPPLATLVVTKAAVGEFQVGKRGVYSITVRNDGPTEDPGPITVTDQLPNGLTYVSSDAEAVVEGQNVVWTLADGLAVGEEVTITLTVDVSAGAFPVIENTITVTSPTDQTTDAVLASAAQTAVAEADPLATTGGTTTATIAFLAIALMVIGGTALVRARRAREAELIAD